MIPLRQPLHPVLEPGLPAEREDARRQHLQRVLASQTFARAHQLRALLNWLSHQALTEESRVPSEREVAEVVMRRGNFDPQTDSLVRKEMGRLREKLAKYYTSEDPKDGLRITLPAGYRVRFEDTAAALPRTGMAQALWLPFRASAEDRERAHALWEEMLFLLSRRVTVVGPSRALALAQQDALQPGTPVGAAFVIEGRYQARPKPSLVVWVTRADAWRMEAATQFDAMSTNLNESVLQWLAPFLETVAPARVRSRTPLSASEPAFALRRGA